MNLKGATVWFTGLPSSGKSTIAREVYRELQDRGCATELLDGAEVRENLSRGLSFSREDREENVRRIGFVAQLLSRNGVIAVCAAVSPYRASRAEVRARVAVFVEVYVECPVELAESRDDEGLYARARRGEIPEFTGVSAPYEPPERPEVHLNTATMSLAECTRRVLETLERLAIIPEATAREDTLRDEIYRRLRSG